MSRVRVYEVAKQLNLDPKTVVALFQAIGVSDVRNHMSSVEPDAIERAKRHLEKQKTHDVVEERIRPTVVKRRAVAKPIEPAQASAVALPPTPPSSHAIDRGSRVSTARLSAKSLDRESRSTIAPPAPSSARPFHGRGLEGDDEESIAAEKPQVPMDLPSERPIPAERVSARRLSGASGELPASRESTARLSMSGSTEGVPVAAPSGRKLAHSRTVSEVVSPGFEPIEEALLHSQEAIEAVERFEEPPVTPDPGAVSPTASGSDTPAPVRPSSPPKTGVHYWAGRPGVPMPTAIPRLGPQPNMGSSTPRRVQYDPRAGAASTPARREVRAPGQQSRGPANRGGAGGQTGFGRRPMAGGMRKAGGVSSTQEMSAHKKVIRIEENITLQSMAGRMSLKSTELLMKLLSMGMTGVHINTTLDADTAKILASEFGWEIEDVALSEEANIAAARGEEVAKPDGKVVVTEGADLRSERAPVVTVMGHVDHGKTSLLDKIRKANVAGGEAGGITQHIGAYRVSTSKGPIVFLDTPGHEAFTQMRARGASVTDIVVLVVAADDGVMPQTREAVNHARAAKVPIIVAVNKIDKPGADPERVKRELVEIGLQPEEWGGDTIFVNVSAKTGVGIEQLLEMLGLQSEVLELKANAKRAASGTVLEALLDRGRGPVARVLVQDGTLRVGDFVLAGPGFGKVRAMTNEHGKQVHEAGPSTPVEILGLSEVPGAGDPMDVVKDAKKAQEIAEGRRGKVARSLIPSTAKVSLEELSKRMTDSGLLELRVVVKGDVQGSVEAVAEALAKLSTDRVKLLMIHAGVGAITEGDVNLAIAAKAILLGFNVRPAGKAAMLAEENKIEIRVYSVIYSAVDDIRSAMEGLLPPTLVERKSGSAEIRQVFKVKNGAIAGCYVTQGSVKRSSRSRLMRDGAMLWEGKVATLKRFKEDVKEVAEGFECGISLDGFSEIKEGDFIETYEIDEIKQKL